MRAITKRFNNIVALDNVDFKARTHEIHCLFGENGAGKTTLMRILYGVLKADSGEVYVEGKKKTHIDQGEVAMVHQNMALISGWTVAENLMLSLGKKLSYSRLKKMLHEVMVHSELEINLSHKVEDLSMSERQRVEIIKALLHKAKVLILDEPTSVLSPVEIKPFFEILQRLTERGLCVIMVTHKLREALEMCDRITVLRAGKLIATLNREEISEERIIKLAFGTEARGEKRVLNAERGEGVVKREGKLVLNVKNLKVLREDGSVAVDNISFSIYEGMVFGIAGVAGNGQRELVRVIAGLQSPVAGQIILLGKDITGKGSSHFEKAGGSYIPEDAEEGLVMSLSLTDNSILTCHEQFTSGKIGLLKIAEVKKYAEKLIRYGNVLPPNPNYEVRAFSGGNRKKILTFRELFRRPPLILAENPTADLDYETTSYLRSELLSCKREGSAVLLVSMDLDEVLELSDEIAVMYRGRLYKVPQGADVEYIGGLMIGRCIA
jgi:simple sugar transport system ATP-binding protein